MGLKGLFSYIKPENIIWIIMIVAGMVIVFNHVYERLKHQRMKLQYLIRKDKKSILHVLTIKLTKIKLTHFIIRKLAIKIGMFTKYSLEKNLEYATAALSYSIGATILGVVVFLPSNKFWYVSMFYLMIGILAIALLFYMFFAMARMNFIKKLPDTYKILNSRYISKGNILKAIHVSMDDFDRVIRKEMVKIYNVLKKNNMEEIEYVLSTIDETYNDEYLTILLSLIRQAHFKGGNKMIKEQFETLTEEILEEIENRADLMGASRSYIFLSLAIPVCIPLIQNFNQGAIGDKAKEFYETALGSKLPIMMIAAVLAYMGFLLFMERTA